MFPVCRSLRSLQSGNLLYSDSAMRFLLCYLWHHTHACLSLHCVAFSRVLTMALRNPNVSRGVKPHSSPLSSRKEMICISTKRATVAQATRARHAHHTVDIDRQIPQALPKHARLHRLSFFHRLKLATAILVQSHLVQRHRLSCSIEPRHRTARTGSGEMVDQHAARGSPS